MKRDGTNTEMKGKCKRHGKEQTMSRQRGVLKHNEEINREEEDVPRFGQ
jgi:hypothetical protein